MRNRPLKRLLALALVLGMLVGTLPVAVFAFDPQEAAATIDPVDTAEILMKEPDKVDELGPMILNEPNPYRSPMVPMSEELELEEEPGPVEGNSGGEVAEEPVDTGSEPSLGEETEGPQEPVPAGPNNEEEDEEAAQNQEAEEPDGGTPGDEQNEAALEEEQEASEVFMSAIGSRRAAQAVYVNREGGHDDDNTGLSAADPVKTLEKAWDISNDGDIIYIMDGVYITQDITIENRTIARYEDYYFLDGRGTHANNIASDTLLYVRSGATLTLKNTTVTSREIPSNYGAIVVLGGGTLVLEEGTVIEDNLSQTNGAAIWADDDSTVEVKGAQGNPVIFRNNMSRHYEHDTGELFGMGYGGAIYAVDCTLNINYAEFQQNGVSVHPDTNAVTDKSLRGGAIMAAQRSFSYDPGAAVTIANSTFDANYVQTGAMQGTLSGVAYGGAVYVSGSGSTLEIDNCDFNDNLVRAYGTAASNKNSSIGGALAVDDIQLLEITNSSFVQNMADQVNSDKDNYIGFGGAIATLAAYNRIENTEISGNIAQAAGGGISIGDHDPARFDQKNLTIIDNEVAGNTATDYQGGGLAIHRFTNVNVEGVTEFSRNTAHLGGVYIESEFYTDVDLRVTGPASHGGTVTDAIAFAQNRSGTAGTTGRGAAIYGINSPINIARNVEFSSNTASELGGAIASEDGDVTITGGGSDYSGELTIYSDGVVRFTGNAASGTGGGAIAIWKDPSNIAPPGSPSKRWMCLSWRKA